MKKKLSIFVLMVVMLVMVAGCSAGPFTQANTPAPNQKTGSPSSSGQISLAGESFQVYAPGSNPTVNTADAKGRIAGFGIGVWHGFISPVTLAISFFNKDVQMYDEHNVGNLYNLGFLLGLAIIFVILSLVFGLRR